MYGRKGDVYMNTIITIGRQFGSGGREIGKKVAEHFGIKFYDKDLLTRAAKESGFCEEMIQSHDERPTNSFLYNLVMDTYSFGYNSSSFVDMPISHKVFLAQFDTIKKIASEGPCVIVGRCADSILKETGNSLNIYIHAGKNFKAEHLMERNHVSYDEAVREMERLDKRRASHYKYYADQVWGFAENYHLCLDSSLIGIEKCVSVICDIYRSINAGQ